MLYRETAGQDRSLDESMLEWAALWKPLPEVVFRGGRGGPGR